MIPLGAHRCKSHCHRNFNVSGCRAGEPHSTPGSRFGKICLSEILPETTLTILVEQKLGIWEGPDAIFAFLQREERTSLSIYWI
jgi:hypothetical protein